MTISTVTVKGQVTLPSYIRKELDIKPSDKVVFARAGKRVYVEKAETIEDLFGSLGNKKVVPLSTSKMRDMIDNKMFSKDDTA